MTPDWTGSFSTNLTWKGLTFGALIDVRYGGEFLSLTDAIASETGNSARTLKGRDGMVIELWNQQEQKIRKQSQPNNFILR